MLMYGRNQYDTVKQLTSNNFFFLMCLKNEAKPLASQLCLTLRDPMDCSPPGSSVHGIFQARIL